MEGGGIHPLLSSARATCCQFIYSSPNHLGGAIESNSVLFGREETCLFCLVAGAVIGIRPVRWPGNYNSMLRIRSCRCLHTIFCILELLLIEQFRKSFAIFICEIKCKLWTDLRIIHLQDTFFYKKTPTYDIALPWIANRLDTHCYHFSNRCKIFIKKSHHGENDNVIMHKTRQMPFLAYTWSKPVYFAHKWSDVWNTIYVVRQQYTSNATKVNENGIRHLIIDDRNNQKQIRKFESVELQHVSANRHRYQVEFFNDCNWLNRQHLQL